MIYGYLENGEPKKVDQNKRDKLIVDGKYKSTDFMSFDSDKAYNDWAKIKKSDKAFNNEINKNIKFRNEGGKTIVSYKGQDFNAYSSEQEAKDSLRKLWDTQNGNAWGFGVLLDKGVKTYKDKVTKEANSKSKKRYLVANGTFKKSGYDDGTRYASVSDTPPTDGKSYIEFTGTLDEANAEIKRLNGLLNKGDNAQQEAINSPAGTAKDDQLENQTDQNTAAAVMNGENSADAQKKGAQATIKQKEEENKVNPGYVKGENEATPTDEKKKIEEAAGKRLPGDTLDDGSQQKIKDQEEALPGNINLPSGKRNKPEEKKDEPPETTNTTQPPATNTTTEDPSKLLNDYKLGKLNAYPTLKAVVDMISKNAKMNMDRAGLLTGGQRYDDAYDAIETETDKMMDANRELRSEEAIFEDALREFDNGNKAPLQALLMSNKTTIERIADAKGITVEEAKEQYGFNKVQRKAQAEQAVLKTEADKQEILAKIDERITGLQNTKAQISEARRQLAGRAWDAYHDTMAAVQDGLKGIFVTGASSSAGRTEGATGTIEAGFKSPIITAGGSTTGSSETTSQNSSTQSIDQLLYKSLEDTQNIATAQMEEQEAANDAHVATLNSIESWIDNAISKLEQQKQRIESTTVNMGTGQTQQQPQQTVAPAPTNLNYTVQPKGGEAQQ